MTDRALGIQIERRENVELVRDVVTHEERAIMVPTWELIIHGFNDRGACEQFAKTVLQSQISKVAAGK